MTELNEGQSQYFFPNDAYHRDPRTMGPERLSPQIKRANPGGHLIDECGREWADVKVDLSKLPPVIQDHG